MILVTGGSGVLGRAVVDAILAAGHRVRVLDVHEPGVRDRRVELVTGSVTDRERVRRAVDECVAVCHLAGRLPQARLGVAGLREVNVGGTRRVAEACVEAGVARMVFASTIEIYGAQEIDEPLDEDAERRFTGPYSRTKWEGERLLLDEFGARGLQAACLRMPMILGPGFYHEKSTLALFWLLRHGRGLPMLRADIPVSYVSADDAAQAFVLACERDEAAGEVFNVAAGDTPVLEDFFRQLGALVGSRSRPVLVRAGAAGPGRWARTLAERLLRVPRELSDFASVGGAYSIAKARRLLGFSPARGCAEAWADAYRWFYGQPLADRVRTFARRA